MEKPVDMKLTKREAETDVPQPVASSTPRYPWGLTIRLDNTTLDKLGMGELPDVGALCQIMGVGRVISVEEREYPGGDGPRREVSIQIEKLNLAVEDEDEAFEKGAKKGRGRGGY